MLKLVKDYFDSAAKDWDKICVHNPQKIKYVLDLLNIKKADAVLDCGCGTGILENFLPDLAGNITAVDISPKMIEVAKGKFKGYNIKFLNCDLFDINSKFDLIILYSIYPHIFDKDKLSKKLYEILKPSGRFAIFHTDGKNILNNMHNNRPSGLSVKLNDADTEKKYFENLFDITLTLDDKDYFLIYGVRK